MATFAKNENVNNWLSSIGSVLDQSLSNLFEQLNAQYNIPKEDLESLWEESCCFNKSTHQTSAITCKECKEERSF